MSIIQPTRPLPQPSGVDTNATRLIKINGVEINNSFLKYKPLNKLVNAKELRTLSNGEIDNKYVDKWWTTDIELSFNLIDLAIYRWIAEQIRQEEFELEFYDYTLGATVTRFCILNDTETEKVLWAGEDIDLLLTLTITATSKYGYNTFADLKNSVPLV